jgi:hypothetical protein
MGDGTTRRDHHLENEGLVIGCDDCDYVRSSDHLEMTVITAEVFDEPGVNPIDEYLRAPRLDVKLNTAAKTRVRDR